MKIGEAQKIYSVKLNRLRSQKQAFLKQQKEIEEKKINPEKDGGVILEWSDAKQKELDEMQKFMDSLMTVKNSLQNMESTKQQTKAMEEAAEDFSKCIETARRISKGDRVPPYDEKKLMEFSFEMYLSAKNAAMINRDKSNKKRDSLWEEEEDSGQIDPGMDGYVDDMELSIQPPEEASVSVE